METRGKWKVLCQVFDGTRKYIAGRVIDTSEPQHGGNMEYAPDASYTEDRGYCERLAAELNLTEGN